VAPKTTFPCINTILRADRTPHFNWLGLDKYNETKKAFLKSFTTIFKTKDPIMERLE